jgi:hypothetical protein
MAKNEQRSGKNGELYRSVKLTHYVKLYIMGFTLLTKEVGSIVMTARHM